MRGTMKELIQMNIVIPDDGLQSLDEMNVTKTILFLCPTIWDEAELPRIVCAGSYRILTYGTDVSEHPENFDAIEFIDRAVRATAGQDLDGVMASDDYPGSILAAAVAEKLNLPGPRPKTLLLCHHKYYSRLAQQQAVPEAVPAFWLIDRKSIRAASFALPFPLFVKPVKSFFSLFAEQVGNGDELRELAERADQHLLEFVKPFNELLTRYTTFPHDGSHLIGETLLHGQQVTVEGFIFHGEGGLIGITDSIMYHETISFQRFEYPSVLGAAIQDRMEELALRFMHSIGFDDGLFNIEMFYESESDAIYFIEVNPRMCPQFADLMEKVNGVNTYEVALSIAAGSRPTLRRETRIYPVATSFVLRLFEDQVVTRVPNEKELAAFAARFPDARLKILCREGHRLSEELQDGKSYRYAILNMGGHSRAAALNRFEEALQHLQFVFEAIV
jgi:biotin carboxylase